MIGPAFLWPGVFSKTSGALHQTKPGLPPGTISPVSASCYLLRLKYRHILAEQTAVLLFLLRNERSHSQSYYE
jgi:hypothetical protein